MIFLRPVELHGDALQDELAAAGWPDAKVSDEADGTIRVVGPSDTDRDAVQAVIDAHVPPPPPDPLPTYAELVAEVRGIKERAAAADVADPDARKVRDAVAGP